MDGIVKVAFCDDKQEDIAHYETIITDLSAKHGIGVEFSRYSSGKQLLFELEDPKKFPDILYLDINMPELDGVQTAHELRDRIGYNGAIIFLTVHGERVFDAFDVDASFFAVKEKTELPKFERAFMKAVERYVEKSERKSVVFSCAGESCVVPVADIKYFEVQNRIVTVHYGDGDSFEFYSTMDKISNQLGAQGLIRIHRSFMVSIYAIDRIYGNEATLVDGTVLPIGKAYAKKLKEIFAARKVTQNAG